MDAKLQEIGLKNRLNYHFNIDFIAPENSGYYVRLLLAYYSMPTLLKQKPSSLFSMDKRIFWKDKLIRELEYEITSFDCHYMILYEDETVVNILVYHEELLSKLLASLDNEYFLASFGYQLMGDRVNNTLHTLKSKITNYHNRRNGSICFPHEIGIILGYPIQDVEDFIRCNGKNYILNCGWKVYQNVEEAVKKSEGYKNVRKLAIQMVREGGDLKEISNTNGKGR